MQKQPNADRFVCGHKRGGAHPSCSLYISKPPLTYPSIIEKQGDSIHHACCGLCHPDLKGMPKTGTEQLVFSTYRRTSYVAIVIPSSTAALSLYVWVLSTSLWTCHTDSFLQIVLWSDAPKKTTIATDIWIRKDSHRQQDMLWNILVRPFSKCRKSIRFLN